MASDEQPQIVALTESEQVKIRLEETYRNQVRAQLTPRPSQKVPLVGFLNSSLGLWMLSALFLTLFPSLVAWVQAGRDKETASAERALNEEHENRQAVEKLDFEISYRLSVALINLKVIAEGPATNPVESEIAGVLQTLDAKASLYPDFLSYSLPALFVELRRRIPPEEGAQRDEIEKSLATLIALTKNDAVSRSASAPNASEVAQHLLTDVIRKRWKSTRFYYVDCAPEKPFC